MTFSLAARCPRTGEIGMALATSSMAAGGRAMSLSPAGAVFAQARSDPALGALGLARLEAGCDAQTTLDAMLAATPLAAYRQLAVLDAAGRHAHATGSRCLAPAGAVTDEGVIALGNAVANDAVIPAILQGFAGAAGSLAERLLAGLEAGTAAGGEPYPLRSAALRVCRQGVSFPVVDLRVDLAEAPVAALRHHWAAFEPLMEGYLLRAIDPANAPLAATIEGHLRAWPVLIPSGAS